MDYLPYGARHLFKKSHDFNGFIWQLATFELEIVEQYERHQTKLIKPLCEVDNLLDSDQQWEIFCQTLIMSGRRYSNSRNERKHRAEVEKQKNEICETALKLARQLREYQRTADQENTKIYGYYYEPALDDVSFYLGRASDIQNESDESYLCNYRDVLEPILEDLRSMASRERIGLPQMPSVWAVVEALAEDMSSGLNFNDDVLLFSQTAGPADFIRGFTEELKRGINTGEMPEKLMALSFNSLNIFTSVLYPHVTIRSDRFIDKNWNPKKDSYKAKRNA